MVFIPFFSKTYVRSIHVLNLVRVIRDKYIEIDGSITRYLPVNVHFAGTHLGRKNFTEYALVRKLI